MQTNIKASSDKGNKKNDLKKVILAAIGALLLGGTVGFFSSPKPAAFNKEVQDTFDNARNAITASLDLDTEKMQQEIAAAMDKALPQLPESLDKELEAEKEKVLNARSAIETTLQALNENDAKPQASRRPEPEIIREGLQVIPEKDLREEAERLLQEKRNTELAVLTENTSVAPLQDATPSRQSEEEQALQEAQRAIEGIVQQVREDKLSAARARQQINEAVDSAVDRDDESGPDKGIIRDQERISSLEAYAVRQSAAIDSILEAKRVATYRTYTGLYDEYMTLINRIARSLNNSKITTNATATDVSTAQNLTAAANIIPELEASASQEKIQSTISTIQERISVLNPIKERFADIDLRNP